MKFKVNEQVFTEERVDGIYPTENMRAIVRAYKSDQKRYLLEFEKYVGGFAIKYDDQITKVGYGLWVKDYQVCNIKYYKSDTEEVAVEEE